MSNYFNVGDQAGLEAAIEAVNQAGATSVTIDLAPATGTLSLDANLPAIQLGAGETLTILGNGMTLDGSGVARGFYVSLKSMTSSPVTPQRASRRAR